MTLKAKTPTMAKTPSIRIERNMGAPRVMVADPYAGFSRTVSPAAHRFPCPDARG
jgi:hypothetical protein